MHGVAECVHRVVARVAMRQEEGDAVVRRYCIIEAQFGEKRRRKGRGQN